MGIVDAASYRVETVFSSREEGAVNGLHNIESAAHGAHSATSLLSHALGALGVGVGLHELKEGLIDFNEQVQNNKIGLSAMLAAGYGTDYESATAAADKLYGRYQKISQQLPITTSELSEFGNAITFATIQSGGGLKDIETIAQQGSVAAKVFGKDTIATSQAITEMLQGNARKQNGTVQLLLGLAHMDSKQWNKLGGGERLAEMNKILTSDAMNSGRDAMTSSFRGVVSTLEDRLQLLMGKIGLPLFKAITAEVASWSAWMETNADKVDRFAKSLGSGLVDGFNMIRSAFEFIAAHSDELIAVAKVYAAIKIGGSLVGGLGGMGGGLAGLGKSASTATAGNVGAAFAGGYEVGTLINERYGLSDSIAKVVHVNGETLDVADKTTAGYARIVTNLAALDQAIDSAKLHLNGIAGAAGTQANMNLQGMIDQLRVQANIYSDHAYHRDNAGVEDQELVKAALKGLPKAYGFGEALGHATTTGGTDLSETDVAKNAPYSGQAAAYQSAALSAYADKLEARQEAAQQQVNTMLPIAIATMKDSAGAAIDRDKASASLMQQAIYLMSQGKMLSMDDVRKTLGGADMIDKFKGQAKTVNNVTNNVRVEMSAKDPDRWMQELDEKINRKIRSPTQAKGARHTRGGI